MSKTPKDTKNRISQIFQKRFADMLNDNELSVKEFANIVGVSLPVIRLAYQFGIIPSVRPLIKIADFTEVSFDYLVGFTDTNDFIKAYSVSDFHSRYEELKNEKKVRDSQIANVMPFSRNFISEWKRNKTLPSLDYLKALADYFKVSIDYLLGRTDYKN